MGGLPNNLWRKRSFVQSAKFVNGARLSMTESNLICAIWTHGLLSTIIRIADEDTRCYLAGYSRYATIELTLDSGEVIHYMMVFKAFCEKKKLRLHVESAYPLEERPGGMKKIKFLVIAHKTLLGKEIKQPK